MKIRVFTTGGTIDKIYYDAKSDFHIGDSQIAEFFGQAYVDFDYEITSLLRKDSLDMNDADRELVRQAVAADAGDRILITHGTDTMIQTALQLRDIPAKTIVLTGAMQPSRMKDSDAAFNVGCALAALQTLPAGVYIAMSGRILDPANSIKNVAQHRFEATVQQPPKSA